MIVFRIAASVFALLLIGFSLVVTQGRADLISPIARNADPKYAKTAS